MRSIVPISDKPRLIKKAGHWICVGVIKSSLGDRLVSMWGKTPKEAYSRYRKQWIDGNRKRLD